MFRCLSCGSSGALLTTFQSRSNLVKLTPVITPTFFSPYHRTFRCLGLAGPLVLFSLNSFRGPTRQSQSLFLFLLAKLPPCTPRPYAAPPPPLLRRLSAAARAPLLHRFAAAPQTSRSFTASRARPSHAAPAPLLRSPTRAQAAPVPPTRRHRHRSLSKRQQAFSTILLHFFSLARVFKPNLEFSAPLIWCTQGVRGIDS